MANNLYKVGGRLSKVRVKLELIIFLFKDWVYCEISAYQPHVIRRIEELTKVCLNQI